MAPIEINSPPSRIPALISASHVLLVGYLSFVVARTIYRSKLALAPSSSTRNREPLRRSHIQTFSILAVASFAIASFFAFKFSSLSYRVWAAERGIELPEKIFGDKGAFRGGEHPGRLHLVRWLNDTPYYRDLLEIVSEKSKYFWWGQQVNLGLISWSTFLAFEGKRRNIANLWAFLTLSLLVNLSFAQNLFFIAVLLTPVPLPENVKEITRDGMGVAWSRLSQFKEKFVAEKPHGFVPKPALYITLLVINYLAVFLLPYAANTSSFSAVSRISRIFPFVSLALPYIIPTSWGSISVNRASHKSHNNVFITISAISFLLHFKVTAVALSNNAPEQYTYRHTLLHPFSVEHNSAFSRGSAALTQLLGAIAEHPAVSAVGWDVIISALSLGMWAAIRGLDSREMLEASIPFMRTAEKAVEQAVEAVKAIEAPAVKEELTSPPKRRPGRPRKPEADDSSSTSAPRRRGRSSKTKSTEDNTTYELSENEHIEEGDEDTDADWESAALTWGCIAMGGLGLGSAAVYGGS